MVNPLVGEVMEAVSNQRCGNDRAIGKDAGGDGVVADETADVGDDGVPDAVQIGQAGIGGDDDRLIGTRVEAKLPLTNF